MSQKKDIEEWLSYTPNDWEVYGIEDLKDVELYIFES